MLNDSKLKAQLEDYLKNLIIGIKEGYEVAGVKHQIVSESDLERFVRVGMEGDVTLLRILGYNDANVDDHPVKKVLVGTTQFAPDYILRRQQKNLVVLDLKKPEEDLDNKRWVGQVLSYCQVRGINAPLGLLFNGYSLRVFINTDDRQLSKYDKMFSDKPVATAEYTEIERMTELLSKFAADSLQANPINLARKLANKQMQIIGGKKRQEKIRTILTQYLAPSPPGEINEVLSALATVESLWQELDPQPTEAELVSAWHSLPSPIESQKSNSRPGINPDLRKKITEVCAKKGWAAIEKAHIKGLKFRFDGIQEQGYRLVPQCPNVPHNLCVQGKDVPSAKRVIQELDKLLTS